MQLTNKKNIPDIIYKFLQQDFYDNKNPVKESVSVTALLKPIKETILSRRYGHKIEIDVADRVWSVIGSGVHSIFENMLKKEPHVQSEQRLSINLVNGMLLSGKYDFIINNIIHDFKVTSAYSVIKGDKVNEWGNQLSMYRWLYFKSTGTLLNDTGAIILFIRDWKMSDANKNSNYPQTSMTSIDIKLSPIEDIEKFIYERTNLILKYEQLQDSELPPCSNEEKWYNERTKHCGKCDNYCGVRNVCDKK